ncbi:MULTISPECIES: nucleotidyltransferase family protein [Microbulbifer]|uniref:Polymerase nucleotidyl transferase domain-containing protein n=1 Tax=Microbulbifer rhizosphaerae TaxID=1562603 RepID=A0A7W4WFN9_9GAMM|nr:MULTISPECIES: nucleotidyltransferase family protein [Microbulbifer]MBB3062798.1 hypothetical protein [Microbulbifer rhizosphaerae]
MIKDIEAHSREIAELCQRYGVRRLAVFGSAATGHTHPGSDVDLLVEFDLDSTADYADRFFGLQESLQQLFGKPVDLVVESAVRNPYFRQSIEETQELLYAA